MDSEYMIGLCRTAPHLLEMNNIRSEMAETTCIDRVAQEEGDVDGTVDVAMVLRRPRMA